MVTQPNVLMRAIMLQAVASQGCCKESSLVQPRYCLNSCIICKTFHRLVFQQNVTRKTRCSPHNRLILEVQEGVPKHGQGYGKEVGDMMRCSRQHFRFVLSLFCHSSDEPARIHFVRIRIVKLHREMPRSVFHH